jgi:hypothetical protein
MAAQSVSQRTGRIARIYLALRRVLGSAGWSRYRGYRPEKHYMRGPGPKSRARHGDRERGSKTR